ncbi:MAG: PIG-L family deacetylase [Acidobacteria bacterium]|nr:PIG-L family deacetylase [Acidobacteriota bacterium]
MNISLQRRAAVCILVAALAVLAGAPVAAQSLPEALEAIDRARITTRILYVTAHPDDEPGAVLAYLARGLHADVALLSLTRGEGGQNALGPEQGPQLAILRTEELLAAAQAYGVRLYFTRAPDFGYSKTTEETLKTWGDVALDDLVRVIRTFRPHVVINNWGGVRSGHGHHQSAGLLTPQAVASAADPKAFPQQLAAGLKPWHAALLLQLSRGADAGAYPLPLDQISPIWGQSYRELGLEGFLNHRTQGIAGFLNSPFLRRPISLLPPDGTKLDAAQLARPLTVLAAPGQLNLALERADRFLTEARAAAPRLDWAECARHLADTAKWIAQLESQDSQPSAGPANLAPEELDRVRERIDAALVVVAALRVEAQADRSEIVAGENFSVRVAVRRRAEIPGEFGKPSLVLPAGWSIVKEEAEPGGGVRFTVAIPKEAKTPTAPDAWMLPWPPALVQARVHAVVAGHAFDAVAPVISRRATSTRVDTLPLRLAPAVTLALEPRQFVIAEKRPPKQLELLARVHYYGAVAGKVIVGVQSPAGWQASAPQSLEFTGAGDQLVRFTVTPPARMAAGNYALKAYAQRGADTFDLSLDPLPSLPTRLWSQPAVAVVNVFDVAVPENLHVGYVAAENDPIPDALRRLGVQVELLDPVALAFGDLRRFDAVAIGIRAYELRDDLARANPRLLDYAAAGGTLVVQYQRENTWTALKPAPFPAAVGSPTVRITDEHSPVRFLAPGDPLLNFPNKITQEDFQGWVQERGLYFWSQWDARYLPVLALRDPGEEETLGGLVSARTGKGVYIYTGLAFFRQLPDGVPGAYRLFVNLLSQSKTR